jgi:hypothetical protein
MTASSDASTYGAHNNAFASTGNKHENRSSVVTAARQIAARLKTPWRPFSVTGQPVQSLSASAEVKVTRPNSPLCSACLTKKSSINEEFYHHVQTAAELLFRIQEIFHALFYINHHRRKLGGGAFFCIVISENVYIYIYIYIYTASVV